MQWRVLISAPYFLPVVEEYRPLFNDHGIEMIIAPVRERLEESELLELVGDIDGTICGDDRYTDAVFKAAPRLKVISKWGTGIDSIDQEAARNHGVLVCRTPNAFTQPVADTTLGYILTFARQLPWMDAEMKKNIWKKIPSVALHEWILGVIGVGNIGKAVIHRAHAFGMKILGNDIRSISHQEAESLHIQVVNLQELLQSSDIISIHCDLNPTSRHLVSSEQFSLMKPHAIIINTARGPIINEGALERALATSTIGGAALDVFEQEPLPSESPLRRYQNVLLAAHNSNSSPAAWKRVHESTIQNLITGLGINRVYAKT